MTTQWFRPFNIHLADGRSLHIPHPDYLFFPLEGALLVVAKPDGSVALVDTTLITQVAIVQQLKRAATRQEPVLQ